MADPQRRSRRRLRKKIVRRRDGSLFDPSVRRSISVDEVRDHVRDGWLFEARWEESGADCTYEVLRDVVGAGALDGSVPGLGGTPLSGLGALAALVEGPGRLGGFGGAAEGRARLADLVASGEDGPPARPKPGADEWHLLDDDA